MIKPERATFFLSDDVGAFVNRNEKWKTFAI